MSAAPQLSFHRGLPTALFTLLTVAAVLSFVLGAGFAAVATLFGDAAPAILVALALAPLWVLAVLANPLFGAFSVFATFPVGSVGTPLGFVTVQAAEAAVLVVGLLIVLHRLGGSRTPLPWSPPLTWALALLGWSLVSFYSAVDTVLALKQIISLAGGIVFACVVLAACRHMIDLRNLLAGFVGVAALISLTALSSGDRLESRFGGSAVVSGRLQGAFDHPNQLGSLCALAAPIAVAFVLGARTFHVRLASGGALALVLAALMLSLSRGAWIGAGLAFAFMLVALPEARRLVALLALPAIIVALFVPSFAPESSEVQVVGARARALTELSPYDDRDDIYDEALREIRSEPITGVGPGGFPVASARASSEARLVSAKHAHSLALTWAAETGLPGLFLIVGFAIALGLGARSAGRAALARGDVGDRAIAAGVAAALLSVAGQGLFDYTLRNAVVHIALWGMVGALLVCRREAGRGYPVR